jgi:branched-chain amino acid transport system substrate-binding protein
VKNLALTEMIPLARLQKSLKLKTSQQRGKLMNINMIERRPIKGSAVFPASAAMALVCWSTAAFAFDCADGAVRLGMARSITGGFSAFDIPGSNGMKVAVDQINAAGGIDGCLIEILEGDTQSNPAVAGQVADDLIAKGAKIIIPASDMDMGMGSALAAQSAGLLSLSPESGSPDWVAAVAPNHFIGGISAADLAAAIASFMNERNWDRVYTVTNESYNWFSAKDEPFAAALNGKVVGQSATNDGMSDFGAIASLIREQQGDIDAIFLNDYFPRAGTFLRQLRAAGVTLPVVGETTLPSAALPEVVGAESLKDVYYVTTTFFEGTAGRDPELEVVLEAYETEYGAPPENLNAIVGYQLIYVLADALKAAGSTDATAVAAALRATKDKQLPGATYYSFDLGYPKVSTSVGGFDEAGNFVLVENIGAAPAQ